MLLHPLKRLLIPSAAEILQDEKKHLEWIYIKPSRDTVLLALKPTFGSGVFEKSSRGLVFAPQNSHHTVWSLTDGVWKNSESMLFMITQLSICKNAGFLV